MVDDADLAGLDPYDLMATERARIDRHFSSLSEADWQKPTRCEGWDQRALLAHLAATENYNRACLDGTVQQLMAAMGEKGATDIASFNEVGIHELDDQTPQQILETWRAKSAQTIEDFRTRDGGEVDSSIGGYPARWQAFHLAFELATHADDVAARVEPSEERSRIDWQAHFGRFALKESKPDVAIDGSDGHTHVKLDAVDVELPDEEFVQALAARVPPGGSLDPATAAALSVTP
jgi:uncharacterized protein (TIGR03083 family)